MPTNPAPQVTLDLDNVEREETYKPFVVNVDGKAITFTDPAEIDWKDLLDIEEPAQFLRHAVSAEDRAHLKQADIPGWKFKLLMESYTNHYGLDLSRGNGIASRI